MRGLFGLQVLGLGGHEVGAVERDDRLTAPHVVPLRNAHLFDPSGDARDDARDAAVVERDLAVGLEHGGQLDLAHFAERGARYARGVQLKQFLAVALVDDLRNRRGRRLDRGAAGR